MNPRTLAARAKAGDDAARPIEGWLRVVVRNWCRDHRRREGRAARLPTPEEAAPGDPERALDLSRGARSVAEAFGALTPRQRQAWDLIDRQGLPTADAAAELGVTPSTVRVLVHQARRALRASLKDGEALKSWLREQ